MKINPPTSDSIDEAGAWTSFIRGVYTGLVDFRAPDTVHAKDKRYWQAGFVFGWILKILTIALAGSKALP